MNPTISVKDLKKIIEITKKANIKRLKTAEFEIEFKDKDKESVKSTKQSRVIPEPTMPSDEDMLFMSSDGGPANLEN